MKANLIPPRRSIRALVPTGRGFVQFTIAAAPAFVLALASSISALQAQTAPRAQTPMQQAPRAAQPAPPPPAVTGIWFDDTGQGAVEIIPCGERLCGHIVWLRDPVTKAGRPLTDVLNPDPGQRQRPICGLQVIGDLAQQPNGTWDKGWIYDPKEGKSYDVEIALRAADRLQVKGYLGVKFLSETFTWTRAPGDIQRCSATGAAVPGTQATAR